MTVKDIIAVITVVAAVSLWGGVLVTKVGSLEDKVVTRPELENAILKKHLVVVEKMNKEHRQIRQKIARYHNRGGE